MAKLSRKSHEATSSRAQERSTRKIPSAPPMPDLNMHSTFELRRTGTIAQGVLIRSNYSPKPTMRMKMLEKKVVFTSQG